MPQPVLRDAGPDADEAAMVARAKADPRAFGEIYREHYRGVAACIYRRVGDLHTSEDLAAETFVAAYRAIRSYRHGAVPLRHWLLRIATNTVSRWARRNRGREAAFQVRAAGAPAEAGPSERLASCLRRLPASHQDAVSLHYVEGLTVEEAARALGCAPGTIKSRLARARARLKELLDQGERS